MAINSVVLVGRLGADPEVKYLSNGVTVANFNIAVDRGGKGPAGERMTDWFRVETYDKLAEICANYLTKGKLVGIEGRLEIRSYTDKAGNKQEIVAIRASNMQMLSSKSEDAQNI